MGLQRLRLLASSRTCPLQLVLRQSEQGIASEAAEASDTASVVGLASDAARSQCRLDWLAGFWRKAPQVELRWCAAASSDASVQPVC